MHANRVQEHISARAAADNAEDVKPYSTQMVPMAELFGSGNMASMHQWLDSLALEPEAPTDEQRSFLMAVIERIEVEAALEQADRQEAACEDPFFDVIHGVPGAGKNKFIGWLRDLFVKE